MEHIISNFAESIMKSSITLATLRIEEVGKYIYFKFLRKQQEMETLSGTQLKEEMNKSRLDLEKISQDRRRAIDELSTIRVVPSTKYLGKLLDQPRSNIEYGISRVEKLVMEKIKEAGKSMFIQAKKDRKFQQNMKQYLRE